MDELVEEAHIKLIKERNKESHGTFYDLSVAGYVLGASLTISEFWDWPHWVPVFAIMESKGKLLIHGAYYVTPTFLAATPPKIWVGRLLLRKPARGMTMAVQPTDPSLLVELSRDADLLSPASGLPHLDGHEGERLYFYKAAKAQPPPLLAPHAGSRVILTE